jgi:hypothetical protein
MAKKRTTTKKSEDRPPKVNEPITVPNNQSTRTLAELSSIKKSFAAVAPASGSLGCCWFKDPSGRDYGVPCPSAQACKDEGGIQWTPAPCTSE